MPPLEDILHPSILLDQGGQPLAIGAVRFETNHTHGRFVIQNGENPDQLIAQAKTLKMGDGTLLTITKLYKHPAQIPSNHLVFEY